MARRGIIRVSYFALHELLNLPRNIEIRYIYLPTQIGKEIEEIGIVVGGDGVPYECKEGEVMMYVEPIYDDDGNFVELK